VPRKGEDAVGYPLVAELTGPAARVAMPRLHAAGGTVHVVGRCNNREFCFTTAEGFGILLTHLSEMARTYEVRLYAQTLMANHVHLLHQRLLPRRSRRRIERHAEANQ
jgi:REP element-mobilizing transposase RayT